MLSYLARLLEQRLAVPHPGLTLATLQQIVLEVDAAPGLDEAIGVVVRRVRTALQADVCSVHLTDHDRRELVLIAADGADFQVGEGHGHDLSRGLPSWVLERAAPPVLENVTRHPRCTAAADEAPLLGYLGVPIGCARASAAPWVCLPSSNACPASTRRRKPRFW